MTRFRGILLATSSWLLFAGIASAADIPRKARPLPPPPSASWAGFYLGAHGGYGWGKNPFSDVIGIVPPATLETIRSKGAVYGGQFGYNWQFGRAVAGFEVDFSVTDINGSTSVQRTFPGFQFIVTDSLRDDVKYLGSARARVGWAPADTLLFYGTAGPAWQRVTQTDNQTVADAATASIRPNNTPFDRFGWVGGAGIEWMPFGPNWVGRIEYLHYDFGVVQGIDTSTTSVAGFSFADRAGRQTIDVVRAGLSYKFGGPSGPLSARASIGPVFSWTGFYIGAHGGYGWHENSFSRVVRAGPAELRLGDIKSEGAVYGGQMGHNWQYDRAVAGIELDFSAANIKGSSVTLVRDQGGGFVNTETYSDKVDYLGSLRGRVGWLPIDNVLLYGTAGLAWERLERTTRQTNLNPGSFVSGSAITSFDRFGWVAGAGVETMLFGTNWVGRIEYLHYDFGAVEPATKRANSPADPSDYADRAGRQTIDVVRAGVSYRFGEPAARAPLSSYASMGALPPLWSGFYFGAHGGYGWKENDFTQLITLTPLVTIGGIKSDGAVYGAQAGYNWQYGRVVAGAELDFSVADIRGGTSVLQDFGNQVTNTIGRNEKVKYLGTARAKLGLLPVDNVLIYATGGLAWERRDRGTRTVFSAPAFFVDAAEKLPFDHFGAVIGAGAEWMPLGPNWIMRAEYLHYDFGKVEGGTIVSSTIPGNSFSDHRGRQTIDVARFGVSYKLSPM